MTKLIVFFLVLGLGMSQAFADMTDMDVDQDLESYMRVWECPAYSHICDSYEECNKIISEYEGQYILTCSREALAIRKIGMYLEHFQDVALLLMNHADLYEGGRNPGPILNHGELSYRADVDYLPCRYVLERLIRNYDLDHNMKELPQQEYLERLYPIAKRYIEFNLQGEKMKYAIVSDVFSHSKVRMDMNRGARKVLKEKGLPFEEYMMKRSPDRVLLPALAIEQFYRYGDGDLYILGKGFFKFMEENNLEIIKLSRLKELLETGEKNIQKPTVNEDIRPLKASTAKDSSTAPKSASTPAPKPDTVSDSDSDSGSNPYLPWLYIAGILALLSAVIASILVIRRRGR